MDFLVEFSLGLFLLVFILPFILFFILAFLYNKYTSNPFDYPKITVNFDISGKRQPVYEDYIDEWINGQPRHLNSIKDKYAKAITAWEKSCNTYLDHCIFWKSHRKEQYENIRKNVLRDEYKIFKFIFYRNQTIYHQRNYQKTAYKVQNTDKELSFSLNDLLRITGKLNTINYQTTRAKWDAKNQRSLMTKELKDLIKRRDNYTCRICGKYMPDEVGLHIDHIIPIKKGGKSVESNLQVLCDKCNLKKGKK